MAECGSILDFPVAMPPSTSDSSILVTGATGMVGRALISRLHGAQPQRPLHILTRKPSQANFAEASVRAFSWFPDLGEIDPAALDGVGQIVHLAGEPVAQRWTPSVKARIMESRVSTLALLRQACQSQGIAPRIISASAIGWYEQGEMRRSESDPAGPGFLSEVVQRWEQAAQDLGQLGGGEVRLRIGLVLDPNGGVLHQLAPLYRWGLGTALAPGTQWQSWIHSDDLVSIIEHALCTPEWKGAFNAVAPKPVRQEEFSRTLARVLLRPHLLPPVPQWAIRLRFGEAASALLSSHRIQCHKLITSGFEYAHPELEGALRSFWPK